MITMREGNLQITFPATVNPRRFDDPSPHGLSHCMKAVDFVVELSDKYYFIEFKDPQNPKIPRENLKESDEWLGKFLAGNIDEDFKYKYSDTFLYEWASERANKPIYYLVLVAFETLTDAELLARTDDLKRKIPLSGPSSGVWMRSLVDGCTVFNIATWNKHLSDYRVSRLP